jgi:hypothetical protein
VKVIVRQRNDRLVTRIVNDTLQPFTGTVEYGWWRLDNNHREVESCPVIIQANSMLEIAAVQLESHEARDPSQWLYAAVLLREDGSAMDQSIWTLRPHRELALATPEIKVTQKSKDWLEISCEVFCHGVHIEDHGREVISDNWFDLLPGVPHQVKITAGSQPEQIKFTAITGK